jgi:hypothetical protein
MRSHHACSEAHREDCIMERTIQRNGMNSTVPVSPTLPINRKPQRVLFRAYPFRLPSIGYLKDAVTKTPILPALLAVVVPKLSDSQDSQIARRPKRQLVPTRVRNLEPRSLLRTYTW